MRLSPGCDFSGPALTERPVTCSDISPDIACFGSVTYCDVDVILEHSVMLSRGHFATAGTSLREPLQRQVAPHSLGTAIDPDR